MTPRTEAGRRLLTVMSSVPESGRQGLAWFVDAIEREATANVQTPFVVRFGPDATPEQIEAGGEQIAAMIESQRSAIVAAERARLAEEVREQVCECTDHSKCRDCHANGANLASRVPTWFVLDLLEPEL